GIGSFEQLERGCDGGAVVCSGETFSRVLINIVDCRELCALITREHACMNSGDVTRAHDSDSDLCHLRLRHDSLCRGVRVTRELEWVSFPVFRTKDLNTRNLVVADLSERCDHVLQRQDAEARQQTVTIF